MLQENRARTPHACTYVHHTGRLLILIYVCIHFYFDRHVLGLLCCIGSGQMLWYGLGRPVITSEMGNVVAKRV